MLRVYKAESFFEGSFADELITDSEIDFEKKYFKFKIEGAESEDEHENRLIFKNIEMEISNWSELTVYWQIPETEKIIIIPPEQLDVFTDIILFLLDENSLKLMGFGKKTLEWYEYHFTNPKIVIKGELVSP